MYIVHTHLTIHIVKMGEDMKRNIEHYWDQIQLMNLNFKMILHDPYDPD